MQIKEVSDYTRGKPSSSPEWDRLAEGIRAGKTMWVDTLNPSTVRMAMQRRGLKPIHITRHNGGLVVWL